MASSSRPFFMLIVLDGFGCRREAEWNAIKQATTPRFDHLFNHAAWTTIDASGLSVGLPEGQMGNSEVGHLNIGAGRVVDQDIVRITKSIRQGEMQNIPSLVETIAAVRKDRKAVHLVGLLSEGGVHSLQSQLHGLIDAVIANGMVMRDGDLPSIYVHAILDGRDTPPQSAIANVNALCEFIADKPQVRLASIIGRYYTMDRDKRWERVQKGYDLMTLGIGTETKEPVSCIERFYESGKNDEFMPPIAVLGKDGAHHGKVRDGDAVIFFNFRSDRMRQIVTAFRDDNFDGFEREMRPNARLLAMVRYREDFDFPVLFPKVEVRNHLGQVFAAQGMKQLRIAETEKYAHVTFFFNGGSDEVSEGEDRILIPSSKVPTYDLKPEMSVREVTERAVAEIDAGKYDAVVMNIANPDMVGHTGFMEATVTAVEETDSALTKILEAVERRDGIALITADHGNCELMFDSNTGQPHTAHTTNKVPLILVDPAKRFGRLADGGALENVAPTILDILGIEKPAEMTARSLLLRNA
ncbi:MAG: 2,3-bisphosphoglycerate-independent phosphoglycerate mutase [Thermoanaerobaculia bacterium]